MFLLSCAKSHMICLRFYRFHFRSFRESVLNLHLPSDLVSVLRYRVWDSGMTALRLCGLNRSLLQNLGATVFKVGTIGNRFWKLLYGADIFNPGVTEFRLELPTL